MPRRYHAYPPEFQVLNVLSTAGASILARRLRAAADLPHLLAVQGREGGRPIRGARRGLEWEIPSPPPTENFTSIAGRDRTARTSTARARRSALPDGSRRALSGSDAPAAAGVQRGRRFSRAVTSSTRTTRSCSTTSTTWSSRSRRRRSACGCSWSPKSCSSAACSWPTSSTGRRPRRRSRRPATT